MAKRLLYIGNTQPSPGFGSSIIFYRHLTRLKDWTLYVLTTDEEGDCRQAPLGDWELFQAPPRKWWLPVKTRLPWTFEVYLSNVAKTLEKQFKKCPSAILNQFGKKSCLAYYLSKKWNVPLNLIIHDRWEVWAKGHEAFFLGQGWDKKVLNQASRIWVVSDEMGEYYRWQVAEPSKISTLYPIPEESTTPMPVWKDEYSKMPTVGFSGSFHSHQIEVFKKVAEILKRKNGKLIIISKKIHEIKSAMGNLCNVEYKNPFEKNVDVIEFFKKTVSAVLVADSIDKKAYGESLSFPSRFIEFSHCGLPIIIAGTSGTALTNFADRLNWKGYARSGDIDYVIDSLITADGWRGMAKESIDISKNLFSAERIQDQFLNELVTS